MGRSLWAFVTLQTGPTERMFFKLVPTKAALLTLPWLVYCVPTLGGVLLRLRRTGYDQQGLVRSVLTLGQVRLGHTLGAHPVTCNS